VLYQLSYVSEPTLLPLLPPLLLVTDLLHPASCIPERETGLEPATSSLEGLRSTS
jgi:hypothetical protein